MERGRLPPHQRCGQKDPFQFEEDTVSTRIDDKSREIIPEITTNCHFWEFECGRRILKSRGKKGFGNAREATGSSPSHSVKLSCEVLDTLHKLPGNIWQLQFAGSWFILPFFT